MFSPVKDPADLVFAAALKARFPSMIWVRGTKGRETTNTIGVVRGADFAVTVGAQGERFVRLDRVVAHVGDQDVSLYPPSDESSLLWVPRAAPAGLFAFGWMDEVPDSQAIMREAMRSARASGFLLMRVVEWLQVLDQVDLKMLAPVEAPLPAGMIWKPLRPVFEPHDSTLVVWVAGPVAQGAKPQMLLTDTSGNKVKPAAVQKQAAPAQVAKGGAAPGVSGDIRSTVSTMLRLI